VKGPHGELANPMFLQSTVVPICTYKVESGRATVLSTIGTAFFIDRNGHFMTAKHVILAGDVARKAGVKVGLVVKDDGGKLATSSVAPILSVEDAPEPFDVSIGSAGYKCDVADLYLSSVLVDVWQDVATYGYPLSAKSGPPESFSANIRCLKGYVQRIIAQDELHALSGKHPVGYELSFLIGQGASGSPLFYFEGNRSWVIGICVGSYRSEVTEHIISEVKEGGDTFTEKLTKVEQFGIAQAIHPLMLNWKPELSERKTLLALQRDSLP
jgi:hypothetical protein